MRAAERCITAEIDYAPINYDKKCSGEYSIKEYCDHDGISIFADYRYYPNQMIFNKVLDALKTVNSAEDVQ